MLCQLFLSLPNQDKEKFFSHPPAQVSTQIKVRFSPPGSCSEETAQTERTVITVVAENHDGAQFTGSFHTHCQVYGA